MDELLLMEVQILSKLMGCNHWPNCWKLFPSNGICNRCTKYKALAQKKVQF